MNTIKIREFRAGDAAALYEIFYSAVHQVASADYSLEQLDAWAPSDINLEAWYDRVKRDKPFIALTGDEIAGFADLQDDGYIDQFFVSSRYPRCGIGRALMEHIFFEAAAKDLSQLTSDVSRTAEPFYLRFGFEVVERKWPVLSGVALPNARMRKRLLDRSPQNNDCTASSPYAIGSYR